MYSVEVYAKVRRACHVGLAEYSFRSMISSTKRMFDIDLVQG